MAYYDALIAKWATLPAGDTTEQKLAAINALTVAGPKQDVSLAQVVRYLGLNLKLAALQKYAAAAAQAGSPTEAQIAGAEFAAVLMCPNAPPFFAADSAALNSLLTAVAGDASSGLVTDDVTNLMALFAPQVPWWQASTEQDGGGLGSQVAYTDLEAAGGLS